MPLPIISVAQMREWENASWSAGRTEADVIRRVGEALATTALKLTRCGDLILLLAGKGHNGDDVLAMEKHLPERRVEILNVNEPKAGLTEFQHKTASGPALIVDGLFGIGLNRVLDENWRRLINAINESRIAILAADVPSGLNPETGETFDAAIRASVTVTVGAPKRGLISYPASEFIGRLEVANDVGLIPCPLQSELNWTLPDDFLDFPPARRVTDHKGTFGHLGIVAGSVGFHGAAVLAARGAQRARPGRVTLFPHEGAYFPIAAQLQAVMVHPWTANPNQLDHVTAVLAGPGLAAANLPEEMKTAVRRQWRDSLIPTIIDASALDWLPQGATPKDFLRVITPHPGEAARLLKTTTTQVQANRLEALRELSRRFGHCWVVLKGHQTLIGRSSGDIFINSSGNAHLAQGGTGDVLAGFIAGLFAQPELQNDPLETLSYAVWQHGATADLLEIKKPNWIVEDLIEHLGAIPARS